MTIPLATLLLFTVLIACLYGVGVLFLMANGYRYDKKKKDWVKP
jgi:hypothetical protein